MPTPAYFVVRSDVSADSGQQRVYGAHDTEQAAAEEALRLASSYYGEFAVVGPAPVALNIVREGGVQAVRAEPVEQE